MTLLWINFPILISVLCASLTCTEEDRWEDILGVISAHWLLQKSICIHEWFGLIYGA
jgi:hypothetical protein